MKGKCQMYSSCNSTKHIKCELAELHECNTEWFPCPKQVIFGYSSMVKCFETKEDDDAS